MDVRGLKVTVFGMARSGLALADLLVRRGASVTGSDSRPLDELPAAAETLDALGAPFVLQGPAALEDCDIAVLSPGVRPDLDLFQPARARGVIVTGDVEMALTWLHGPVLGITGSNGKTTTTALCGHLLRESGIDAQVGGNIGTPVASMVDTSRDLQWNVLELSSFQTEMFQRARIHIAVALNVTPDHLDRHNTIEQYAAAKSRIFLNQQPQDFAVLNAENALTRGYAGSTLAQVHWFNAGAAVERGFWLEGSTLIADGAPWLPVSEIPLRGRHNIENVLAAGCACRLAGAPLGRLRTGVASFPGVEHRIEFVRSVNGVAWFNDSKATNVDAAIKALESFESGLWLILGGKDKDSDYRPLRALLRRRARGVLLIGAAAAKINSHLAGNGESGVVAEMCGDLETAVRRAYLGAQPGDTVLLAPACASFDQFQSYEHRGRVFKELVASLEDK